MPLLVGMKKRLVLRYRLSSLPLLLLDHLIIIIYIHIYIAICLLLPILLSLTNVEYQD